MKLFKTTANAIAAVLIVWPIIALFSGTSLLVLLLFSPFVLFVLLPVAPIFANQLYPGPKLSKAISQLEMAFFVCWFLFGLCLFDAVHGDRSIWHLPQHFLYWLGAPNDDVWGRMIFIGLLAISVILSFATPFQAFADKRHRHEVPQ